MRSNNGQHIPQRYRVINSNKKLKIIHRASVPTVQKAANKRFSQTKLKQSNLLSQPEVYQEEEMSQLSDMEYMTEAEAGTHRTL